MTNPSDGVLVGNYRRCAEALRAGALPTAAQHHRASLETIDSYMRNSSDPHHHHLLQLLRKERDTLDFAHALHAEINKDTR